MSNEWAACQDKLLWRWRDDWGGLLPTSREEEMGGCGCVCCLEMKPFQTSIICLCSSRPVFVHRIDSKLLFLRPYHGSQRGRPNLILRSSNIPQSNITRLRSYHIQRERAIFFHHSSLLSLFQSSTNAGPFFPLLPRLPSLIGQNERTSVKCWRSASPRGRWLI